MDLSDQLQPENYFNYLITFISIVSTQSVRQRNGTFFPISLPNFVGPTDDDGSQTRTILWAKPRSDTNPRPKSRLAGKKWRDMAPDRELRVIDIVINPLLLILRLKQHCENSQENRTHWYTVRVTILQGHPKNNFDNRKRQQANYCKFLWKGLPTTRTTDDDQN